MWAGISATAKTDLVFIEGILNEHRYINVVLTPYVLPFLRQIPVANTIFQEDNARPHRARFVDDFLRTNNVNRTDWPAMSHDLSCKEHVLDVLGRAQQHAAGSLAIPERRMAPNSTTDYSGNSCTLQRTESVNADVNMVVTHTIEY